MICPKCKKEIPDDFLFCNYCGTNQKQERIKHRRGNGQGSVYKRGSTWTAQVQHYVNGERKRVRKGGFKLKKDALQWIADGNLQTKKTTFAGLYDEWLNSSAEKLSDSKRSAYKTAYNRIDRIANTDITLLSINELQTEINGLSYYQARDIKNLLSHLYKRAIAEGTVQTNLSSYMELPKLVEEEKTPYNEEEIKKIWEAYDKGDSFCAYPLLMIYTGMMPGELLNVKTDMIDWQNQKIVGAGLKTQERKKRPIMIPDIIIPVLHFLADGNEKLVKRNRWAWYDDYHDMSIRIGIRDLPPYACRHTTASALSMADKVAPLAITRIMRQARVTTTERYQHAEEKSVLEALNKSFESMTHN